MITAKRYDWTDEEEKVLVNIAFDHIRNNKKMKDAWKKAEEKIGRTAAACKFRWVTRLSEQYSEEIKRMKNNKGMHYKPEGSFMFFPSLRKTIEPPVTTGVQQEMNFDDYTIIDAKKEIPTSDTELFRSFYQFVSDMEKKYGDVYHKMQMLSEENEQLKQEINEKQNRLEQYQEINELIKEFNKIG